MSDFASFSPAHRQTLELLRSAICENDAAALRKIQELSVFHCQGYFFSLMAARIKRLAPFVFDGIAVDQDEVVVLAARGGNGHDYDIRTRLTQGGKLTQLSLQRRLPQGLHIRAVLPSELSELALVELDAPLELAGGVRQFTDRTRCFENYLKLADPWWATVMMAGNRIAGFQVYYQSNVLVGGKLIVAGIRADMCVRREFQRLGLNDAMAARTSELIQIGSPAEFIVAVVAAGNERIKAWSLSPTWKRGLFRALLNCAKLAGPRTGRAAKPQDATALCGLINAARGQDELFVPYREDTLARRLSRLPADYAWSNLAMTQNAALGVWLSDEREIQEDSAGRSERRLALVADYGLRGAAGEEEFEALLRSACSDCAERGITHLSILSSDHTPGATTLKSIAEELEPYAFQCFHPEPDPTERPGLYVDAAYF